MTQLEYIQFIENKAERLAKAAAAYRASIYQRELANRVPSLQSLQKQKEEKTCKEFSEALQAFQE